MPENSSIFSETVSLHKACDYIKQRTFSKPRFSRILPSFQEYQIFKTIANGCFRYQSFADSLVYDDLKLHSLDFPRKTLREI